MFFQLNRLEFFKKIHLVPFLFVLLVLISRRSHGQCSVTSSQTGTSFSNNAGIGSFAWSSINNIALSDNVRTNNGVLLGVLATANTNYIVAQNFGFTIPLAASICGIEVTIEARATGLLIGSSIRDNSIRLIKNNIISGTNMANPGSWPGSDGSGLYGSVSEMWGSGWTPADINASDFGVAISARLSSGLASLFLTAEIDQVSVRVFYNIILPVQLLNFKAIPQLDKVKLEWATASENNSHYFTVERSVDGATEWKPINSVAGAGNSNTTRYYQTTDPKPLTFGFYRLRQTDINGNSVFSIIVATLIKKEKSDLLLYPNPVRDEMNVLFPGKAERILLKNIFGTYMILNNISSIAGGVKVKLPELKKGYYWLVILTPQQVYTKKILILAK